MVFGKKKQGAAKPGVFDYSAVDKYVAETPVKVQTSVTALAKYLSKAGKTDRDRARAMFMWIATNLRYDLPAYEKSKLARSSAVRETVKNVTGDSVLENCLAVCSGYAILAEELAVKLGLKLRTICGWTKGYRHALGQPLPDEPNHDWSAVELDGKWELMDMTWGSGTVSMTKEKLEFVPAVSDRFFCTPPLEFLHDHLPVVPKWQLVEKPITREEFVGLVYLRRPFFHHGLRLKSHPFIAVDGTTGNPLCIELYLPEGVRLSASLRPTTHGSEIANSTLVQVGPDRLATVVVSFLSPGSFVLPFFVSRFDSSIAPQFAMEYRITVTGKLSASSQLLPIPFNDFLLQQAELIEPLDGTLTAASTQRFAIRVPHATKVAVTTGGVWTHLVRASPDDPWTGDVTMASRDSNAKDDVKVLVQTKPDGQFAALLQYSIV